MAASLSPLQHPLDLENLGTHRGSAEKGLAAANFGPQREEDGGDVYWRHRKDAFEMMRLVEDHLQAAADAFWRGDHISACKLSVKAQHEWIVAKKLHAEAAQEILSINNCNNDVWTLDLHGLHAAEAVNVVKEHLRWIELEGAVPHPALFGGCEGTPFGHKVLHIITGKGNHSRGRPVLPGVVRSFLTENGYCFQDATPGMIDVWPKF